jgi:hypothetical protein
MDEDELFTCEECGGEFTEDESDAADSNLYCSADCEHSLECDEENCEHPDEHCSLI